MNIELHLIQPITVVACKNKWTWNCMSLASILDVLHIDTGFGFPRITADRIPLTKPLLRKRLQKTAATKCTAFRETGVSRHHEVSIESPPPPLKPIWPSQHYMLFGGLEEPSQSARMSANQIPLTKPLLRLLIRSDNQSKLHSQTQIDFWFICIHAMYKYIFHIYWVY